MKGSVGPGVVPAVLRSIYVDRKTGMLRFIRDDERRSIRFMSGHVVYGQASVTELPPGFGVKITRIDLGDKVALIDLLRRAEEGSAPGRPSRH